MSDERATVVNPPSAAAGTVLMVRPTCFYSNLETAASNSFQKATSTSDGGLLSQALREFDGSVARLERAGARVIVWESDPRLDTPDALFPNNWFSTTPDGRLIIYPMATPNRRRERRVDELVALLRGHQFQIRELVDWSAEERHQRYLEGTGSLIIDRVHSRVFAAKSLRTHADLVAAWAKAFAMKAIVFSAIDPRGQPVYHTNVVLALGERVALVGASLIDAAEREGVLEALRQEREVIELSASQIDAFAGNVLFLATPGPMVAVSQTAWSALESDQRAVLERYAEVVICDVPTIERVGGGGIRCMLAEIFLPTLRSV